MLSGLLNIRNSTLSTTWGAPLYHTVIHDGYIYLSESDIGKSWDEAPLFNMYETARIPVMFTFNINSAIVYEFTDTDSVELSDCTLRIHHLRMQVPLWLCYTICIRVMVMELISNIKQRGAVLTVHLLLNGLRFHNIILRVVQLLIMKHSK